MSMDSLVYLIDGGTSTVQEILDGVEAHSALADEVERLRQENETLRNAIEIIEHTLATLRRGNGMTPEQLRLLRPLRPQTQAETMCNTANLAWTVWPLSAVRAAVVGYCEAFSAAIDPLPRDFCLGPDWPVTIDANGICSGD